MLFGLCAMPAFADPPTVDQTVIAKYEAKLADYDNRIKQLESKFAGAGGRISTTTNAGYTGMWLSALPGSQTSPEIAIYTEKHAGTNRAIVGAYGTGKKSQGLMVCLIADKEGSIQFVDACGKVTNLTARDVRQLKSLLTAVDNDEEKSVMLPKSPPGVAAFDRRSDTFHAGLLD
jgi:hypothetical protein